MSWPGVAVRPSAIGGLGLFALRGFPAGAIIRAIDVLREITPDTPLRDGESADHCMFPDGRMLLIGEPDRYVNHRCEPNAYKRFTGDRVEMIAMTEIRAGDEVTYDYIINTDGGSSWPCGCGAPSCRGLMARSFFDLPSEVQRRYRPDLADWFVRRHAARLSA